MGQEMEVKLSGREEFCKTLVCTWYGHHCQWKLQVLVEKRQKLVEERRNVVAGVWRRSGRKLPLVAGTQGDCFYLAVLNRLAGALQDWQIVVDYLDQLMMVLVREQARQVQIQAK